ncbi:MAG: cobalamin-dependent protein [Desulfobacula sp.]|nr:cobalamin-dependent protein [Desulfobacula sp.]
MCQELIFKFKGDKQTMPAHENIIAALKKAVIDFKMDDCKDAALKALSHGVDPAFAIMNGLEEGMKRVGVLYDTNEYFVPEVLMSADALYAGLKILRPHMKKESDVSKGTIVIGSVRGDVHDIGKNLVKVMFDTAGWQVHDLGVDVPIEKFVEKQIKVNADILVLSAMMTTTMMEMKKIISKVRSKRPECLIMIGGAPVTCDIAALFGADGFAASAGTVITETLKMIARSNKNKILKYESVI